MKRVVILGAGISGLALGWFLKKRYGSELKLTLLEKSSRAGGWIETIKKEDFLFELGPRGFRPKGAGIETLRLIEELGLQDQVIAADPAAHVRYLYKNQKLQKIPSHIMSLMTSLLTRGVFSALCRECFKSGVPGDDPSVFDFISYRLNEKIAEELMDPLNSGIYAGDIRRLSMKSCFPAFYNLEQKYGSLVKGMLFKRKASIENETPFIQKMSKASMLSFKTGMQTLTDSLQLHLQEKIAFDQEVRSLNPLEDKIAIHTSQSVIEADYVFSTLPAKQMSQLLGMPSVEAASVAVVNLGYRRKLKVPKGFGYLIPSKEKETILGMVWDSYVFPQQNQNPEETRLTVMIGGTHMTDFQKHNHESFLGIGMEAASKHLGLIEKPDSTHIRIASEAIPQYFVGHANKLQEMKSLVPEKMSILGASYFGVSVNDCISQASANAFL